MMTAPGWRVVGVGRIYAVLVGLSRRRESDRQENLDLGLPHCQYYIAPCPVWKTKTEG